MRDNLEVRIYLTILSLCDSTEVAFALLVKFSAFPSIFPNNVAQINQRHFFECGNA